MSHICEEYAKSLGVRVGRPKISDNKDTFSLFLLINI